MKLERVAPVEYSLPLSLVLPMGSPVSSPSLLSVDMDGLDCGVCSGGDFTIQVIGIYKYIMVCCDFKLRGACMIMLKLYLLHCIQLIDSLSSAPPVFPG